MAEFTSYMQDSLLALLPLIKLCYMAYRTPNLAYKEIRPGLEHPL